MKIAVSNNTEGGNMLFFGVHRVVVWSIRWKRDKMNKIITRLKGQETNAPVAITVTFKNENGDWWKEDFYIAENSLWRMEQFAKAINIDMTSAPVDIMTVEKKKWLWILIKKVEYKTNTGEIKMTEDQVPFNDLKLSTFYPDSPGSPNTNSATYVTFEPWENSFHARRYS